MGLSVFFSNNWVDVDSPYGDKEDSKSNRFRGIWYPKFCFGHVELDKPMRPSTGDVKMAVGDNIKLIDRE